MGKNREYMGYYEVYEIKWVGVSGPDTWRIDDGKWSGGGESSAATAVVRLRCLARILPPSDLVHGGLSRARV